MTNDFQIQRIMSEGFHISFSNQQSSSYSAIEEEDEIDDDTE